MEQNRNEEEIEVEPIEPKKQEKEEKEKKKGCRFSETVENLKKHKNIDPIISYAQKNTQDTIAYILLVIGILWMLAYPFNGGILTGLVVGFYFSKELVEFIKNFNTYLEEQGYGKSIVLGGGTLALFLMAPGIIIGIAAMAGLKFFLKSN